MENVISIAKFKQNAENSLKNYLNILSFNELIIESTQTLKKIKNESSDTTLISRAIYLLEELNQRIDSSSKKYGDSLSHIREKVKNKIKELNKTN